LYGVFVWVHGALSSPDRRFLARADANGTSKHVDARERPTLLVDEKGPGLLTTGGHGGATRPPFGLAMP
jgi:hypothetical protein